MRTFRLLACLAAALLCAPLAGCGGGAECLGASVACGGVCVELGSDNKNCGVCGNACDPGTTCSNGVCGFACQTGQVACRGTCVDPKTDRAHCGASSDCAGANAGAVCAAGQVCTNGACALTCQQGLVACEGKCIDPRTDRAHCGADSDCLGQSAGKACSAGTVCSAGACAVSCLPGALACAGSCIDPKTDRTFCGATGDCSGGAGGSFGQSCAAGQVCSGGACALSCQRGLLACGGTCVDPTSDRVHCGASSDCAGANAGAVCGAGQVCSNGLCAVTCPAGQLNCNGACVDPKSDRAYCGATVDCSGITAGTTCAAGQVCASGACALSCQAGLLACNGTCTDPQTSRTFCGATADCVGPTAGKLCAAGQVCSAGQCTTSCAAGLVNCGGTCVDPKVDPNHCGAAADCAGANAGAVCAGGTFCSSGVCAAACAAGQVACGGRCTEPSSDRNHCGASGDCSGVNAGTTCAVDEACASGACVSFAPLLDLSTPLSNDNTPPFATAQQSGFPPSTSLWANRTAPLPTNAFWQDLGIGTGQQRVDFAPYQIMALPTGVSTARPALVTTAQNVITLPVQQVLFSSAQAISGHQIVAYDKFSATVVYSGTGGTITFPLVAGMAYVTADYAGLTPKVLAGQYAFTKVNDATTSPVSGTKFKLSVSDGTTWYLYSATPITFSWSPGASSGALTATGPYTGALRVANLPAGQNVAVLDAHAGVIARSVTFDVTVTGSSAKLRFNFATSGSGPLLMFAMPHHLLRLLSPVLTGLTHTTLNGTLQAVEGTTWRMQIPLSPITWTSPRTINSTRVTAVQSALAFDAANYSPGAGALQDPYFGGKYLAKLARLAVIADELGDSASAAKVRATLKPLAAAWLDGTYQTSAAPDPLRYDTVWGGVVSANGLADSGKDFGGGVYNDHHFHYGYHLYAAAALLRADPNAFTAQQKRGLLGLARDIANPSSADPLFPQLRNFDLFRGHSWAHGILEWGGSGSDQESSSEAVNAWYGLQMLGVALGDQRMADLGRLLLALEIDAARTYYQIPAASAIYPAPYSSNRCVGQLFEFQATFQTFFGAEPWKVYGIQMIPFTPASELLVNATWINDSWVSVMSAAATAASSANSGFAGLLYSAHATIDPATAWNEVNVSPTSSQIDDGNSLTNELWWVATRP